VCPGAVLNCFPGVGCWVGKLCVVQDAPVYLLQFHAGSFGASCRGEMVLLFSVPCGIGRFSRDLGFQDVEGCDSD
jgi:hypothetical protein